MKKRAIKPVIIPTHLNAGMVSLKIQYEQATGMTSEMRWAVSVLIIPEYRIDKVNKINTTGSNIEREMV
jgi:hypothetical protein